MGKVKLVWSFTAVHHFSNWIHHIAKDSIQAAQKERIGLLKAVEKLKIFPRSGRVVPEFGDSRLREIICKPIRIIYRMKRNEVRILSFHHAKRNLNKQIFS